MMLRSSAVALAALATGLAVGWLLAVRLGRRVTMFAGQPMLFIPEPRSDGVVRTYRRAGRLVAWEDLTLEEQLFITRMLDSVDEDELGAFPDEGGHGG